MLQNKLRNYTYIAMLGISTTLLGGCGHVQLLSALMPQVKDSTPPEWTKFRDVKSAYDQITPGITTRKELVELGFDPETLPNVQTISYVDVLREFRTVFTPEEMPPELMTCLTARVQCRGYKAEFEQIEHRRTGMGPTHLLGLKKQTKTFGWKFITTLIIVGDTVVYKLWNGTPEIETYRTETNFLGPLRSLTSKFSSF